MILGAMAYWAPPAHAGACRVTDFTQRGLSSLNEVERLSFVNQMTQTEYQRLKAVPKGDPNFYALLSDSASLPAARAAAQEKLESFGIQNVDYYQRIWASDYLTDEELRRFADCTSSRQPGLDAYGRSESPSRFNLTIVHLTPIGIEKVTTSVVASRNISNVDAVDKYLADLGAKDNYTARTISLDITDPTKPAVLIMRAGWETPKFIYIPPYPTPAYGPG
jgi:hypothetical protein